MSSKAKSVKAKPRSSSGAALSSSQIAPASSSVRAASPAPAPLPAPAPATAPAPASESRVSAATVRQAVSALHAHLARSLSKSTNLLSPGTAVHMVVRLFRVPAREKAKPLPIPVPHSPLNPEDGVSLCLIVKDAAFAAFSAALAAAPVPGFAEVLPVSRLRTHYRQYRDRLALVGAHDAFFADDRVVCMMPRLLGSTFGSRAKLPLAVDISGAGWARALAAARDATYLSIGAQTMSIHLGHSGMPSEHLAENALAVLRAAIPRLPKQWKNVQRIDIAATNTVALPIYKALPRQVVVADKGEEEEDDDDDDAAAAEPPSDRMRALANAELDRDDELALLAFVVGGSAKVVRDADEPPAATAAAAAAAAAVAPTAAAKRKRAEAPAVEAPPPAGKRARITGEAKAPPATKARAAAEAVEVIAIARAPAKSAPVKSAPVKTAAPAPAPAAVASMAVATAAPPPRKASKKAR